MTNCIRCGKTSAAEIHTCTPKALLLADALDTPPGAPLFMDAAAELRRLQAALEMNTRTIAIYENEQLDDEALLRQALEALESLFSWQVDHARAKRFSDAIAAIRERLK